VKAWVLIDNNLPSMGYLVVQWHDVSERRCLNLEFACEK
jgi:hypothetical protein